MDRICFARGSRHAKATCLEITVSGTRCSWQARKKYWAATSSAFVTSAVWARPSPPSARTAAVTVSAFSAAFDTLTTFAPCRASTSAVVAPIPCPSSGGFPAPHTTATFRLA